MDMQKLAAWSRFWAEPFLIRNTAAPRIFGRVAFCTAWAAVLAFIHHHEGMPNLNLEIEPFEVVAAVLGILMVLRTNAGNDRWWEARKLWGGIVNQSRNLAIQVKAYGKDDATWRDRAIRRIAAFPYVAKHSLRKERTLPEVEKLLGREETAHIAAANHMPSAMALLVAEDLKAGLEGFAFQQAENQRGLLIDHIGACERILKTPLPLAYSVEIRRFILLFLITLPFALFEKISQDKVLWLAPLIEFLAAYPLLALDKIGAELQAPFSKQRLNHLPLDEIAAGIETNLIPERFPPPSSPAMEIPDI